MMFKPLAVTRVQPPVLVQEYAAFGSAVDVSGDGQYMASSAPHELPSGAVGLLSSSYWLYH